MTTQGTGELGAGVGSRLRSETAPILYFRPWPICHITLEPPSFFNGQTRIVWNFPGQGWDLSCSSYNTRSLNPLCQARD